MLHGTAWTMDWKNKQIIHNYKINFTFTSGKVGILWGLLEWHSSLEQYLKFSIGKHLVQVNLSQLCGILAIT